MDRNDTVAKLQETAADTVAKAQEAAGVLAERLRDAKLDERAAELAAMARGKVKQADLEARATELAATAKALLDSARIDERAADLSAKVRDSAIGQRAVETAADLAGTAREATDAGLDRLGDWLGDSAVGERLGLKPPKRSRPWKSMAAAALAAGAAIGVVTTRRRRDQELEREWAEGLIGPAEDPSGATGADITAPLADRVREAIGQDPRTSTLPELNVNVVDGTVFVRGSVPPSVDHDTLRIVIEGVEGVSDVDLQVTATT